MRNHAKTIIAHLSIIAFIIGAFPIILRADHNTDAIKHLEMAKTAANPAEHLQEAKKTLGTSETEATPHIDEALAAAQKNDKKGMEKHITMAIKELKKHEVTAEKPKPKN